MVKDAPALTPDIEVIKASISDFEKRSTELAERGKSLDNDKWQLSSDLVRIRRGREAALRSELERSRFGVCAWGSNTPGVEYVNFKGGPHGGGEYGRDPLGVQGVFKLSEMTMHYSRRVDMSPLEDDDDIETHFEFVLLCPEHASSVSDSYKRPSSYGRDYGSDIESTVVVKNGKFIREIDGHEVDMKLQTGTPSEAVYSFFGLPEIPAAPRMSR